MKYSRWELNYEVIDLTSDGINNYAFDLPSAMAFICEAVSHGFLILGGDIIIREGKHYIESCDNGIATRIILWRLRKKQWSI